MALQHLRSSTANKRPTPAAMSDGQIALNSNTASPGLFFKDSAGALIKVGPVHVGTTAPNASPASGGETGNTVGEQWLDTTGGTYVFKVWDGSAWRSETGTFVDVNGDTMTGALGIIAGDAATPGLFVSGDTNTGIYSPGADQLAISTNGTGRVFVDSSGNVGVGTANPGSLLNLVTAAGTNCTLLLNEATTSNPLKIEQTATEARIQTTATQPLILAGQSGSGSSSDIRFETRNSERLRITSDGKLGLGTSNPSQILDVEAAENTAIFLNCSSTDDTVGRSSRLLFAVGNTFAAGIRARVSPNETSADASLQFGSGGDATFSKMRILANGNVGIGVTEPLGILHARPADECNFVVREESTSLVLSAETNSGRDDNRLMTLEGSGFVFNENGSEKARIDSSGRLLVGTSSAVSTNNLTAGVELLSTATSNGASLSIGRFNNDTAGPQLILAKSRNATVAPGAIVQNGDELGQLVFDGDDGTDLNTPAARIQCFVDGTPGTNDMPGRLVFSTTDSGASSPTERMRIGSDGTININATGNPWQATGNNPKVQIEKGRVSAANYQSSTFTGNRTGTDGSLFDFYREAAFVGSITVTTSATAYNTSSDYRLKENVVPLTGAADRLNQLQVHRFNFIADPDKTVDGFLAHEAQVVVPECVTGTKDEVDDEGNPVYQGIDQSKLVPLLTAALQEALTKIDTLEARLTAAGL